MLQCVGGGSVAGCAVSTKLKKANMELGNNRRTLLRHEHDHVTWKGELEVERARMAGMKQGSREHKMEVSNGVYPVSSCLASCMREMLALAVCSTGRLLTRGTNYAAPHRSVDLASAAQEQEGRGQQGCGRIRDGKKQKGLAHLLCHCYSLASGMCF